MGTKEAATEKRLDEELRRRGIALSVDEFVQVIADALDELPEPGPGSPGLPHR
ncbi:hypothetical protein [uncultured Gordonia sp.]|uniref:hypothetical protein n=1 Tax=uncultured Gordonia sp. TaxID=198437 RepID=UPI00258B427F|nr:hypothetical protein [uncultured Gordonia sp.]